MAFTSDSYRLYDSFVRSERNRPRTNDVPGHHGRRSHHEDGGRVSSVQKVYVQANISNQYGAFYAQVKYDVKWTDKNGVEHTEQKSTNAYYFKATSDTVFYEAIIPAQKAGSTVYWLIVVTNENGLSSVTEAQQYSVYAI